eukprot:TRINITY_DN13583_c0_g5_i1.p1 TRINITY_DN13583_c0_g5~~TRINITY_DN13583_c0_g5_i1.p1  ORF type:complete len:366 (-),score=16.79 TRINITY_DN13583_c0_g5_i1:212-1216(-)
MLTSSLTQRLAVGRPINIRRDRVRNLKLCCSVQQYGVALPSQAQDINEAAALNLINQFSTCDISIPSLSISIPTAFVPPAKRVTIKPPILLLHGFDSSSLEFRRLKPLLDQNYETWVLDLLGWGFSDHRELVGMEDVVISPEGRREHIFNFYKRQIGKPMVVLGVSLGGAAAIDFALNHPDCVEKLVLVDSQAYTDGIGMMSSAPRWLSMLGIKVLKSEWLRQSANQMAYYDKEQFATNDAMNIGRLHTYLPNWEETNYAFMKSGGYSLSTRVQEINQETMIVWGEQDEILDKQYAYRFKADLKNSQLRIISDCGHCPHLEKPQELFEIVRGFI